MPNIPKNSIIIMDNASYYSVVINKVPNTSSRKQDIIVWLTNNKIMFPNNLMKYELLDLVKRNKPDKKYAIDEILQKEGHEVLRLPPYHCDFNEIELIRGSAKGYYNKNIVRNGYGDEKVLAMWGESLEQCDTSTWENCVRHTNNLIKTWYEREIHIIDVEVEPIIINPNDLSSSVEESDK